MPVKKRKPHGSGQQGGRRVLAGVIAILAVTGFSVPAHAVLNASSCELIADTAVGVYDLAIRNGATHADAAASAQRTFMRRVAAEGGPAPSTMSDDIDDCKSAGMGVAAMCRIIAPFYSASPC